jgi:hypothetical protein
MVDLPTFKNLTQAQANILLEAYRPFEGATTQQVVDNYLNWLYESITGHVKEVARLQKETQQKTELAQTYAAIDTAMPRPAPVRPPEPPAEEPPS